MSLKWKTSLTFLACLAVPIVLNACTSSSSHVSETGDESASLYNRVTRAGKIRCGYVAYPPACIKDPNTGQLSGVFVEALEEAGRKLNLQVEWSEEVSWGTMIEGLETGRYDIIGSAVWTNSVRGKVADFSRPLFYSGIGVYVRPDERRFDKGLDAINKADVRIATIDGETAEVIAKSQFPKAWRVGLPQMSEVGQMLLEVKNKKADVAFVEPYIAWGYLKNNPGALKNIATSQPVALFGNAMMFRRGQYQFKAMLDNTLEELLSTGVIDKLLDKYEPERGLFYRVANPYRVVRSTK